MISVLLPVRNAEKTVRWAIESVVCQRGVSEVIVWDDASSDSTRGEILRMSRRDQRVRYNLGVEHLGVGKCLNECLCLATKKIILRQDADDFSYPSRVERLLKFTVTPVGSSWFAAEREGGNSAVDAFLRPLSAGLDVNRGNVKGAAVHAFPPSLSVDDLLSGWRFPHGPAMYSRAALQSVGGWPEDMETSEDHLLHLRLAEKYGPLPIVPEPLYFVGNPPTRQTRTKDVQKWDRIAEERFLAERKK